MGKVTIQDICKVLVERKGLNKKDASNFVNMMFDTIQQGLERDLLVKVKGLGTFKIIDVDSRESVNVNTGERVLIEGHSKITFVPDALMKELVNKPFSQFETVVLNEGVEFDDVTGEAPSVPLVEFGADGSQRNPILLGEIETPKEPEVPKEPLSSTDPLASNPTESDMEKSVSEDDTDGYKGDSSNGKKWPYVVVACLIGLAGGYLMGNYFPFTGHQSVSQEVVEAQAVQTVQKVQKVQTVQAVVPPVKEDSTGLKPLVEEPKVEAPAVEPKVETTKPVENVEKKTSELAETKIQPEKKPTPVEQKPFKKKDKYAAMDARVRYGAYRIVGMAQTVRANKGETVFKLSRRILGPGMECYVEVYNNLKASTPLREGQEIKIPKLELKKKKKAQRL